MWYPRRTVYECVRTHFFLFLSYLYHALALKNIKKHVDRGDMFLERLSGLQCYMDSLCVFRVIQLAYLNIMWIFQIFDTNLLN